MSAIFVTATGTDVGKTFVTAGLIRHLRRSKRAVDALKPVVSGFDEAAPSGSDPAMLLAALGRPAVEAEIAGISPWRFRASLSPDMAAATEDRRVDFDALVDFCRREIAAARGVLFIEGVGGVMVPLDDRHTVLDWMAALRVPVILVTGSYLGTISHTLTALDVLARRNLAVSAVVVSETQGSTVPVEDTLAAIARFASHLQGRAEDMRAIPVIGLPRLADGDDHPCFAEIAVRL
jgi:dethiobiotin synthetase